MHLAADFGECFGRNREYRGEGRGAAGGRVRGSEGSDQLARPAASAHPQGHRCSSLLNSLPGSFSLPEIKLPGRQLRGAYAQPPKTGRRILLSTAVAPSQAGQPLSFSHLRSALALRRNHLPLHGLQEHCASPA
jgi:hypothetical protein